MYWKKDRERKIKELKNKIRKAAFDKDANNIIRIRTIRVSFPQFWQSLKKEICNEISQDLFLDKIIETKNPQPISDLIMQGLEKVFNIKNDDYKDFVAPIRALVPRPNPYALYLTQHILEVIINDPNVIDVYGTDLEIYKLINRIFKGLLNSFTYQVAEIIWKHKQHENPEEVKSLLDSAKEENKRQVKKVEEFLQNTQWFNKNAIKKALHPLSDYLDKQLEESKKTSFDFKYLVQASPGAHAWKFRENQLISHIRTLYNKYTPLSNNNYEISYNMSLIFEACDLLPNSKDLHETIRKRLQAIDRNPEKFSIDV